MSTACVRGLKSAACQLSKTTRRSDAVKNFLTRATHISKRNLWSVAECRHSTLVASHPKGINWNAWSKTSACYAHSDVDKELAEFLKDEIKAEKENGPKSEKLPKIKDFVITKTNGPKITLTRKSGNETITVKFSVNNTIEDALMNMEEEEGQEENSPLLSRPPFEVEVNKGGDQTLSIRCILDSNENQEISTEDPTIEEIHIQDVALLNKSQEWNDETYGLSGEIMDQNLYNLLLNFLEDRGIDADFCQQLVKFSTSYEHTKYVGLLQDLRAFVESK